MKKVNLSFFSLFLLLASSYSHAVDPSDTALIQRLNDELGMKWVKVEPGCFYMGSPDSEVGRFDNEHYQKICLKKAFYMSQTEVTQQQWYQVVATQPSYFSDCGEHCPVESVSWNDVHSFMDTLYLKYHRHFQLPSEQQWEYAARTGAKSAVANQQLTTTDCEYDKNLDAVAWYCYNAKNRTHPVAMKQPNAWGLYDMQGNVWEWVESLYTDDKKQYRVFRGGSMDDNARAQRLASRRRRDADSKHHYLGFRVIFLSR